MEWKEELAPEEDRQAGNTDLYEKVYDGPVCVTGNPLLTLQQRMMREL